MSAPVLADEDRLPAAERVLAEAGFAGARVTVEGHEREIAAVRVAPGDWERLLESDEGRRVAERVKALGFRYVALDLLPADG